MQLDVSIKPAEPSDKESFVKAMQLSEIFHYPWVESPKDDQAFDEFIIKYQTENNISYLVRYHEQIAGVININQIIRGCFQSAFLGYYAVATFSGKGIMRKGLALVLEKAFGEHELHRLEANIQPENKASINLVQKSGFVKEGFSKRYLKICGQWRDHERWAITQELFYQIDG